MRHITLAFIITLLICVDHVCAAENRFNVKPVIRSVTVYRNSAQVMRIASLQLQQGINTVVVNNLPMYLQDDSVRVSAKGTAKAIINKIEIARSFHAESADKNILAIDAEILSLERNIGLLDAKKAGLIAQAGFIDSIKSAWGSRIAGMLGSGKPVIAELNEAITFAGNSTIKVEEQKWGLENNIALLKDKIEAMKRKKHEIGVDRKESKKVEIEFFVIKEGTLTFELSSVVNKASWEPSYSLRLSDDGKLAELSYRGQVWQQTGEDWSNVALTLSTASPSGGGTPPAVYPWHIGFRQIQAAPVPRGEMVRLNKMAVPPQAAQLFADDFAGVQMDQEQAVFKTALVETTGAAVSFNIPGNSSIPADNSKHDNLIAVQSLAVNPEYVAIPKLSDKVWLMAELANQAPWPILPGQVRIFHADAFVGMGAMKHVAIGEKFILPFGVDEQVTVKRNHVKQHKEGGIFGKSRMSYKTSLTIANLRKDAAVIRIKDQLPLADDAEISVSLEGATMQPVEKNSDGTLVWRVGLGAGETKELNYEIAVEYPKERHVTGL